MQRCAAATCGPPRIHAASAGARVVAPEYPARDLRHSAREKYSYVIPHSTHPRGHKRPSCRSFPRRGEGRAIGSLPQREAVPVPCNRVPAVCGEPFVRWAAIAAAVRVCEDGERTISSALGRISMRWRTGSHNGYRMGFSSAGCRHPRCDSIPSRPCGGGVSSSHAPLSLVSSFHGLGPWGGPPTSCSSVKGPKAYPAPQYWRQSIQPTRISSPRIWTRKF